MFSKSPEPRSIASQLVLLFTPAAALLLCCALGVMYWIVVAHLFEEDNAVLADRIFAIHARLKAVGGPQSLFEELKIVRRDEHVSYWVRVIDPDGRVLAETPGMTALLPANLFPTASIAIDAIANLKNLHSGGKLFSLTSTTADIGGRDHILQMAQDRSADEEFARKFAVLVAVVLAGGALVAAVIAITVTKRGLRPLAEITRSLKRIGPNRLYERVVPAGWPRELQPLAVAFDDMLDRLEASFTRLSQFSADLAHELRTPVANILGESQVTLTRARTSDEYREAIESSAAECERLSGIIDNLLFLARAESADEQVQRAQFDGKIALEKIAAFYEAVAEEQQITITCKGEGNIYADPMLFGRAVSNLVENALRFTPAGGAIVISIVTQGAHSEISVRDSGCGMAPEHIPRAFDRFYRVDSSRSSRGTGLGLALVKSIIDLHGGSVAIESAVGQGTTVTLTFPNALAVEQGVVSSLS